MHEDNPGPHTSTEEMEAIRHEDRAAQGVSAEEEAAALLALQGLRTELGGQLQSVRLPHERSATVTDRLAPELGGPGFDVLHVETPKNHEVYGRGAVIRALAEQFPACWYGGALPETGYWGHAKPVAGFRETLRRLVRD